MTQACRVKSHAKCGAVGVDTSSTEHDNNQDSSRTQPHLAHLDSQHCCEKPQHQQHSHSNLLKPDGKALGKFTATANKLAARQSHRRHRASAQRSLYYRKGFQNQGWQHENDTNLTSSIGFGRNSNLGDGRPQNGQWRAGGFGPNLTPKPLQSPQKYPFGHFSRDLDRRQSIVSAHITN